MNRDLFGLDFEKKRTQKAVCKRIKRLKKSLLQNRNDLAGCSARVDFENKGNLLSCFFSKMKPGMRRIVVDDLFNEGKPMTIELDETKTPQQNVSFYFSQARKMGRRELMLPSVIEKLENELLRLEDLLIKVEALETFDDLLTLQQKNGLLKRAAGSMEREKKTTIHTFFSKSGYSILVGKDAKSNDRLTFQKAGGNDMWLHAHGCPGSHVVIRQKQSGDVDHDTLVDAMQLALYFSKKRALPNAHHEVIYCRRRDVKKLKGAPLGEVVVANGTIGSVELDLERIVKIKDRKN